jgi:hypothetical protein
LIVKKAMGIELDKVRERRKQRSGKESLHQEVISKIPALIQGLESEGLFDEMLENPKFRRLLPKPSRPGPRPGPQDMSLVMDQFGESYNPFPGFITEYIEEFYGAGLVGAGREAYQSAYLEINQAIWQEFFSKNRI